MSSSLLAHLRVPFAPVLAAAVALALCNRAVAQTPSAVVAVDPKQALVATTLHVELQVADLEQADLRLRQLAHNPEIRSVDAAVHSWGWIIPIHEVPSVLRALEQIGSVRHSNADAQDLSDEYISLGATIRSAQQSLEQLAKIRGKPTTSEALDISRRREALESQLQNAQSRLAQLLSRSQHAVIDLTVTGPLPIDEPRLDGRLPIPWLQSLGNGPLHNLTPVPKPTFEPAFAGDAGVNFTAGGFARPSKANEMVGVLSTGFDIRFIRALGSSGLGWALGFDMQLGAGLTKGFLWQFVASPGIGACLHRNSSFTFALHGGFGGDGVSGGGLPSAVRLPAEVITGFNPATGVRVMAFSRIARVFNDSREKGSQHIGFADEWSSGLSLLLIDRHRREGEGWRFGVAMHELMNTQLFTATVGWGLHSYD